VKTKASLVVGEFALVCILLWVDELWDVPHLLLGAPPSIANWREATLETIMVAGVTVLAVGRFMRNTGLQQRAEESLRRSERKFRELVETIPIGISSSTGEGTVSEVNPAALEVFGYPSKEEFLDVAGSAHWFDPEDREGFLQLLEEGPVKGFEARFRRKDGSVLWLSVSSIARSTEAGVTELINAFEDITERKRAEELVVHLNSVLRAIRNVNQLIVKAKDRGELLQGACDNLVSIRGCHSAWVAVLDDGGGVLAASHAGLTDGFPEFVELLRRGAFPRCVSQALEQSSVTVVADPAIECGDCPLVGHYAGGGRMTARMQHDGRTYGFLSIEIPMEMAMDEEEESLFDEVAGDIAFALHAMELRAERKEAVEALRRSERRYRGIFDAAADGIVVIDSDGIVLDANNAYCRMVGYSGGEMIGMSIEDLVLPDERHRVQDEFVRGVLETGKVRMDGMAARKDGTALAVEIWGATFTHRGKLALLAIMRDVSERKRREQFLRALNEVALAMESALTPDGVFAAAAAELDELSMRGVVFLTDRDESVLYPSCSTYETRGVKAAEKLVGIKMEDFSVPVDSAGPYMKVVRQQKTVFVGNGQDAVQSFLPEPLRKSSGQLARLLSVTRVVAAPLVVDNNVIGVLSVQSDDMTEDDMPMITAFANQMAAAWRKTKLMADLQTSLEELRATQAQLLQAQKLESLGHLAGGIAHDFNNLLTTIGGFASLIMMDLTEDDPRRRDVQRIITAADRAAALTRRLTLFSRRESPKREPLRLNRIVKETDDLLKETVPRTIKVELTLEPELLPIEADPAQMSQVVMNLCLNACDAMPEGGVLTLETKGVTVDATYAQGHVEAEPGRYVRLSVSDTGTGMSADVQAHLFEPFFTTKPVGKGTGLGLSTVYGIVKAHNGFITVYSELGKGSVFHVHLPAVGGGETKGAEEPQRKMVRGTETVLLVDDEEAVLELGRSVLTRCGYTVLTARNGTEALEVYEQHREQIALVVLDMIMPEMDGRECLRRLLGIDPDTRVLTASGHTVGSTLDTLLREGALGVVEKPYSLHDLSAAVRRALDVDRNQKESAEGG